MKEEIFQNGYSRSYHHLNLTTKFRRKILHKQLLSATLITHYNLNTTQARWFS